MRGYQCLPGVALRFHPGLSDFTPSGLKSRIHFPRIREDDKSAGQVRPFDKLRDRVTKAYIPKSKSANGAVAVGLPHRNRSVFKHTHINKQEVKDRSISHGMTRKSIEGKPRMDPRIREDDEGKW